MWGSRLSDQAISTPTVCVSASPGRTAGGVSAATGGGGRRPAAARAGHGRRPRSGSRRQGRGPRSGESQAGVQPDGPPHQPVHCGRGDGGGAERRRCFACHAHTGHPPPPNTPPPFEFFKTVHLVGTRRCSASQGAGRVAVIPDFSVSFNSGSHDAKPDRVAQCGRPCGLQFKDYGSCIPLRRRGQTWAAARTLTLLISLLFLFLSFILIILFYLLFIYLLFYLSYCFIAQARDASQASTGLRVVKTTLLEHRGCSYPPPPPNSRRACIA